MPQRIQIRRDTAANWTSVNPVLAQGEMGYELVTGFLKFGDGVTAWNDLGYFSSIAMPFGGLWNFATEGDFPTAEKAGTMYIAEDDNGAPGDPDYVPAGTWMMAKINGANAFGEFYYKS